MDDLDALLADLENSASRRRLQPPNTGVTKSPLDSASSPPAPSKLQSSAASQPPPSQQIVPKGPLVAVKSVTPRHDENDKLYSKVRKPRSSEPCSLSTFSSSVLGGGLNELDHLLQELNATQFNITDEILTQFPGIKKAEGEQCTELQSAGNKEEASRDKTAAYPAAKGSVKTSATSATMELDRLMASLSDFKVQSSASPPTQVPSGGSLDSMLGFLQSDLSRQAVPTSSKGSCATCEKLIVGQAVTALGRVWHPEHFVCTECGMELALRNFFEKEGKPYCDSDYFSLFSPRCSHCNKPILNKMVTALEKNWHPECFCCVKCGRSFGEDGFHEGEDQHYCQKCFLSLFASRCHGCSHPILENYISALNFLWHPQCFVCQECYTPFTSGSFFEHEGQPLCEAHYHRSRGSVCQACQQPILGGSVSALGGRFHPHHLLCHFCLKPLSKGCLREQEGRPYCKACFSKLFN